MKPILLLLLALTGCEVEKDQSYGVLSGPKEIIRVETPEVVCFMAASRQGLWCHWKENQ